MDRVSVFSRIILLFIILSFFADVSYALGGRRRAAQQAYHPVTTSAPVPVSATPAAYTVKKPIVTISLDESFSDTLRNMEQARNASTSDKRQSAAMEYVLGMDFTEVLEALPETEKEVCLSFTQKVEEKLAEDIRERFPEVRPEVRKPLAMIAAKAYLEGVEQGELNEEILHLASLKLTNSEVLAANEVIAGRLDPEETKAVDGLNRFRMRSGLRPCLIDLLLVNASRGHSGDMRRLGFFSHNSPVSGKYDFMARARQAGASASGENIYMGPNSGNAANSAWINSDGHRANMLTSTHTRVGVGRVGGHFTQMFGR